MQICTVPQNEDVPCSRWKAWTGKSPTMAVLFVDQRSPALFRGFDYAIGLARTLKQQAPQIQPVISLPFPGLYQMGAVANGEYDADYRRFFTNLLAIHDPKSTGRIVVRMPWEFNLDTYQTNTAKDKAGLMNAALYTLAYRRIALIGRAVSSRFWFVWCPNHGKQLAAEGLEAYYPGDDVVDEVGFDFYFQKALWLEEPASHVIAPDSGYGAQWFADFAKIHGKPWCVPELGADDDHFASQLKVLLTWFLSRGCRWVGWWDRYEVINCQISTGALPAIGAVVKTFI